MVKKAVTAKKKKNPNGKATLILHSGDYDKAYSALIIGNGALSMGMDCSIYFTFWGLQRLMKGGLEKGKLSKMHILGLGKFMMKRLMRKANVAPLEQLLADYKELGGKILACDMTMGVMGITKKQLRDDMIDDYCAVGTYVKEAKESEITLFI